MITIREGSPDEFKTYLNVKDIPYPWCIHTPKGLVAIRNGNYIAVVFTTVDIFDRTWLWFNQKTPLSAIQLHRRAIKLLDALHAQGRSVHAFIDPREPGAEKWARRVGFRPFAWTMHPSGVERIAWRKD